MFAQFPSTFIPWEGESRRQKNRNGFLMFRGFLFALWPPGHQVFNCKGDLMIKRFLLGSVLLLSACDDTDLRPDADPLDTRYGARLFAEKCAACHGADAKGGGAESLGLGFPPPDLTGLAARNGGTYPEDYVLSQIYRPSSGPHSAMPAFGEEDLGPLENVERDGVGTPTPVDLLALSNYLKSVQE